MVAQGNILRMIFKSNNDIVPVLVHAGRVIRNIDPISNHCIRLGFGKKIESVLLSSALAHQSGRCGK